MDNSTQLARQAMQLMNSLSGCWIGPKGDVIEVSSMYLHCLVAQDICSNMGINDVDPHQAETTLIKRGWLHVGTNYVGNRSYNDLSDNQASALFEVYKTAGKTLKTAITTYLEAQPQR